MPDYDAGGDPQEGLMKMMKKMYDEGDDQMKQTMRKVFYNISSIPSFNLSCPFFKIWTISRILP